MRTRGFPMRKREYLGEFSRGMTGHDVILEGSLCDNTLYRARLEVVGPVWKLLHETQIGPGLGVQMAVIKYARILCIFQN